MNSIVRLRPVDDGDLPIHFAHQLDPDATAMAAFPSRDHDAFMAHWQKIRADATNILRTIELDGHVAGSIGSFNKDGKRLIGYWVGKEHWGKGIATRAVAELLLLDAVRPLHAYVAKTNPASLRVLQKCGFTICGEETNYSDKLGREIAEWILELG